LMSWRPRLSVRKALIWTIGWYRDYYQNPANAATATRSQIRSFAKLMDLPRCEA
jgi:hypothetical protein